ncbi:RCC1 repeat-containing protein [Myxococcaceae bacterium GXIMD 01537]
MLSASQHHGVALHPDGTVWSWGQQGFVGDGAAVGRSTSVRVPGLTDVVFVAATSTEFANDEVTLALREDGTAWAWGGNWFGQLGDGTRTKSSVPVRVSGLTGVKSVAAGGGFSLAVREDGTVWAWGLNSDGQLGDGTTTRRLTPVQVVGLAGVEAVSGGFGFSVALRDDGTVWGWGSNTFGQLGDGTTVQRMAPVQVAGLTDVVAVSTSGQSAMALRRDGTVWMWGRNSDGNLGDGTTEHRTTPVRVVGLTDVVAIAAAPRHALALREDGTAWAWGSNVSGKLGRGFKSGFDEPQPVAQPIVGMSHVVAMAGSGEQTLLMRADGTLWALGLNQLGALGTGSEARYSPVRVKGPSGMVSASAGYGHSLSVRGDGSVWRWGEDALRAPLLDPAFSPLLTPERMTGLTSVATVAAGGLHSLALRRDGSVWAWGTNLQGELGDGTTTSRDVPAPVLGLSNIQAVATDASLAGHSLALGGDGSVWAWGGNASGQVGNGTMVNLTTPAPVLTGAKAVAAAFRQSLAVLADGTVLGWGYSGSASGARPTPTGVPGLTAVRSVAIDGSRSFAVREDGTVWSWPIQLYGVAPGSPVDPALLPAPVPGLSGVVAVAAGNGFTLALHANGTVSAWGRATFGVLGEELEVLTRPEPALIPGLTRVVSLSANFNHAVAVRENGSVWSWGSNYFGQMGDGSSPVHLEPTRVKLPCRLSGSHPHDGHRGRPERCEE